MLTVPGLYILSRIMYVKGHLDRIKTHSDVHNHNTREKMGLSKADSTTTMYY